MKRLAFVVLLAGCEGKTYWDCTCQTFCSGAVNYGSRDVTVCAKSDQVYADQQARVECGNTDPCDCPSCACVDTLGECE